MAAPHAHRRASTSDSGGVPVDQPAVVAEVAAAFAGYEAALAGDDKAALAAYFWDSAGTIRFGIADIQVGARQLQKWRDRQPPLPPGRILSGTRITTFGADYAVVTTLFRYPGRPALGRQSQTWVRFPAGWRIVHAHVSELPSRAHRP
jgi:hypothetical protein